MEHYRLLLLRHRSVLSTSCALYQEGSRFRQMHLSLQAGRYPLLRGIRHQAPFHVPEQRSLPGPVMQRRNLNGMTGLQQSPGEIRDPERLCQIIIGEKQNVHS